MITITVDEIMAQNPCDDYPWERVENLFAGRESLTAREISKLNIPNIDIVWALIAMIAAKGRDSDKILRHFACDCADRAVEITGCTDERVTNCIAVARRFADGEATEQELAAAWAACAAARAAQVAREVVCVARGAAREASRVAWMVAWGAREAEQQWQIERLIQIIEEIEK